MRISERQIKNELKNNIKTRKIKIWKNSSREARQEGIDQTGQFFSILMLASSSSTAFLHFRVYAHHKKWVHNPFLNLSVHVKVDQIASMNVPP